MKKIVISMIAVSSMGFAAHAEETAASKVMFEEGSVSSSLSGAAGNAAEGRKVFMNRKLGNCLACHENSEMAEQPFHGEVGPTLDGAGSRWNVAELRGIVTNAKNTFDGTIMPAFYRVDGFSRNIEKFEGKSILTAQQVEDVVAYLETLKEE